MNISEIKELISKGKFDNDFAMLYQDVELARERYRKACDSYFKIYGDADNVRVFSAPGST